jgi:hypothetical protein
MQQPSKQIKANNSTSIRAKQTYITHLPIAPPPSTSLTRHSKHHISCLKRQLGLLSRAGKGVFGCVWQTLLLLLAAHPVENCW